jgi:hypothetical protein
MQRGDCSQLAFSRDTLVRLVHALYSVLEFTAALGQSLCYFKRTTWNVAADCRV